MSALLPSAVSPRSELSGFLHHAEGGNPAACPVINALDSDWVQELGPGVQDVILGAWLGPLEKGELRPEPVRKPLNCAAVWSVAAQKHNSFHSLTAGEVLDLA